MKTRNGITVHESVREIVDPDHSCLVVWDVSRHVPAVNVSGPEGAFNTFSPAV
jgi:hypothetical protein